MVDVQEKTSTCADLNIFQFKRDVLSRREYVALCLKRCDGNTENEQPTYLFPEDGNRDITLSGFNISSYFYQTILNDEKRISFAKCVLRFINECNSLKSPRNKISANRPIFA